LSAGASLSLADWLPGADGSGLGAGRGTAAIVVLPSGCPETFVAVVWFAAVGCDGFAWSGVVASGTGPRRDGAG